jgi:hypothetical protein
MFRGNKVSSETDTTGMKPPVSHRQLPLVRRAIPVAGEQSYSQSLKVEGHCWKVIVDLAEVVEGFAPLGQCRREVVIKSAW